MQLVADPGFEQGNNAWWGASQSFHIEHVSSNFTDPRSGFYYASLATLSGDPGNNLQGGVISPFVTMPSNATSATLDFWYSVSTHEAGTQAYDFMSAYLVTPVNQLHLLTTISNLDNTGTSYWHRIVPLSSSFFGQTVQIFFSGFTDSTNTTVFRLDDVNLSVSLPGGGSPSVTTLAPDQTTSSSSRLNMTVNPNGVNTTVWFNLEPGNSNPSAETDHLSIGADTQSENVSISAFGLQCGTVYYVRARASNSLGSIAGSVRSFSTSACSGGAPRASTVSVASLTNSSAILNASIDPNGFATQAWFGWGTTTALGQETPHVSVGSVAGSSSFSQQVSGLSCGTTYYFKSVAQNSSGQDFGLILTFTTAACTTLPVVTVTAIDDTATEAGPTTGTFRVVRTGSTANSLSLSYSIGGTATNGVDYNEISGLVVIPLGSATLDIVVQPKQDSLVEPPETVLFTLGGTSQYVVGNPGNATVTITSDDVDCSVSAISPAGGEVWMKGRPHTIQWSATSGCSEIALNLLAGGVYEETIAVVSAGSQFTWTPAAWDITGSNVQIEVVGFPEGGYGVSTMTDAFSLINPSVLPSIIFLDRVEGIDAVGYSSSYGWGTSDYTSHSTSTAWANIPGFYGLNVDSALTTSRIDLTGRRRLFLTFWQSFEVANLASATVWVRAGQGDWTILLRTSDTTQVGWWPVTIDLSSFLGQSSIEVSFQSHYSGTSSNSGAWYLDDIQVYEPLPTEFYTLQPCRVFNTTTNASPLYPSTSPLRTFEVFGNCGIPNRARAISANVTAVSPTSGGYISLFPTDQTKLIASTVNFSAGQTRANNVLLPLSTDGRFAAVAGIGSGGQVDLVLDVNGYFYDYAPLVGEWQGTLAQQYPADIQISRNGNSFNAQMSTGHPADDLNVVSVSDVFFHAFRPADTNAEIFLYLDSSGSSLCLTGEYIENGGSRPLSVCKVQ